MELSLLKVSLQKPLAAQLNLLHLEFALAELHEATAFVITVSSVCKLRLFLSIGKPKHYVRFSMGEHVLVLQRLAFRAQTKIGGSQLQSIFSIAVFCSNRTH